ncbi:hypothetical protein CROQUDRAFT_130304 [Cronartium quercuum f. sp. fusiforme G11]|uniref:Uncharacterized protein n=1 Tax=Cronartium quercuum f. sp. fusiforme G11 TaxID=708437 RepID=A0A9P6TFX0_9BASI|nr:hypothetical protein CROQUDRAFT_130304 [Cronartium quercuum f. sp. fusiforme G11]
MQDHQQDVFKEAFQFTQLEVLANKCSNCFGPCQDGNFQHQHQAHSSKDDPTDDQYPQSFLKAAQISKHQLTCNLTDAQAQTVKSACSNSHKAASKSTSGTKQASWLLWKLENAKSVHNKSCQSLHPLYQCPNPAIPGEFYTASFFQQQWTAEKTTLTNKDEVQPRLCLELWKLLCLKEWLSDICFWNDGLFTNAREPWAMDPDMQHGLAKPWTVWTWFMVQLVKV